MKANLKSGFKAKCFIAICICFASSYKIGYASLNNGMSDNFNLLKQKSAGRYINALKAGARGNGINDDAPILQKLIDSLGNLGGGTVFLPKGVYLLNSNKGSIVLSLRSRVNIQGEGDNSILKLGDSLEIKRSGLRLLYFQKLKNDKVLTDVMYSNFLIDCNGSKNIPVSKALAKTYKGTAIGGQESNNVNINNISVINNAGRNTFAFSATGQDLGVKKITIQNCTVRNVARGVVGNDVQNDHSVVYLRGDSCIVKNNKFTNDILKTGATAIELHCTNTVITNNFIQNFSKGFNVAAIVNDASNVTITNNTLRGVYTCAMLWVLNGHHADNIKITNNDIEAYGGLYTMFDLQTQVKFPYSNVYIQGNTVTIHGNKTMASKINILKGDHDDLKASGNKFIPVN
ncbi:MAG: hypothetical protein V4456_20265 [Bacteroidota bacterium]